MESSTKVRTPNKWVMVPESEYPKMLPAYIKQMKQAKMWAWISPFLGLFLAVMAMNQGLSFVGYICSGGGGLLHVYLLSKSNRLKFQVGIMSDIIRRNRMKEK